MKINQIKMLSLVITVFALSIPVWASAHVMVTPNKVGVGSMQIFSVSVPNEKSVAVTSLKLDIPAGLQGVSPTTKSGWEIVLDKTGSGESAVVKSITWTGSIPVGQRDDFTFSAQAPASVSQLNWKAYQSYADGSTVHWDQKPAGSDDASGDAGPYSVTKVIDDLASPKPAASNNKGNSVLSLVIASAALITAVIAILRTGNARK